MKWFHSNNFMSMFFVFIIAAMGLILSYMLIINGYPVIGSIFGATGLAVVVFSMRKSPNK